MVKEANPIDTISIDLRNQQYFNQAYQLISSNDCIQLIGLDYYNQKLNFLDLNKGNFMKSVKYGSDIEEIGQIGQFYIHNYDSIFLYAPGELSMYIIDSTGAKIDEYNFNFYNGDELSELLRKFSFFALNAVADYNTSFYYDSKKNSLLFSNIFYSQDFLGNYAYEFPVISELSLSNEEQIPKFQGEFPELYHMQRVPYDIFYNFLSISSNELYLNFSFSEDIFSMKRDSFAMKSAFDNENRTLFVKQYDPTEEEQKKLIAQDFRYIQLLYSESLNMLGRVAKHANPSDKLKNELESKWSVIFYDMEKKEVYKEIVFQKGIYDFKKCFIVKDKLHVIENIANTQNEDFLNIYTFKI
ncbi:MAG: hypothetical protein DSY77_17420 [Bacteroidetes bacterium]|nr:MAG: hypothetical protein DSY77_17420 [Bacteroidota bacterium]